MPAADQDFPRGWTASNVNQTGVSVATVTIPVAVGISRVLTGFLAQLTNVGAAGAFGPLVFLNSSDGLYNNFVLGIPIVAAGAGSAGEASGSGLTLIANPGTSITVSFQLAGASIVQYILIQGYDV